MKKTLKEISIIILIIILCYGVWVFIAADINILNYSPSHRGSFVFCVVLAEALYFGIKHQLK